MRKRVLKVFLLWVHSESDGEQILRRGKKQVRTDPRGRIGDLKREERASWFEDSSVRFQLPEEAEIRVRGWALT